MCSRWRSPETFFEGNKSIRSKADFRSTRRLRLSVDACFAALGGTIGFAVDSEEMANAWHKAGLEHGGTAIENPPGWREGGGMKLHLAYLSDPDGNKICTMMRG